MTGSKIQMQAFLSHMPSLLKGIFHGRLSAFQGSHDKDMLLMGGEAGRIDKQVQYLCPKMRAFKWQL